MDKLCIVMPAYNEEAMITRVVEEWHEVVKKVGNESRLIVLNDGSKDGTIRELSNLKNKLQFLEVIDKTNSGHGPTCLLGYKHAIGLNGDFIFQTDSDAQTTSKDFWKFWEKRNNYDFIFGFRNSRGDGLLRWLISKILRIVVYLIFGVFVKDPNVPFRLMRAKKLEPYLSLVPADFFLTNVLLSVLAVKGGEKIAWYDIEFKQRPGGEAISVKRIFLLGFKLIKDLKKFQKLMNEKPKGKYNE